MVTFTPTLRDLPAAPPQVTFTPTLADLPGAPTGNGVPSSPSVGTAQNIVAGIANPFVNFVNLGAKGMQHVDQALLNLHHALGGEQKTQPTPTPISQIPYQPGIAYDIGNIAGLAIPFTGAERATMAGIEGAKAIAPALEKVPGLVQKMIGTGTAGAATMGATTPGDASEREGAALVGGLTGVGGPLLGKGVSKILRIPKSVLKKNQSKNYGPCS